VTRPARRSWPLALLPALLAASPAGAEPIYRWTGGDGDVHFSQGIDSVPLPRRPAAVIIGHDPPPSRGPADVTPTLGTGRVTFTPGQPIIVTTRVNDSGSVRLILDTGATHTVINPAALSALGVSHDNALRGSLVGIAGRVETTAVRVDSLEVNGARYGPLLVVSHDTGLGPERGDGLLGRDFLDQFRITIDNIAGLLTLTPR